MTIDETLKVKAGMIKTRNVLKRGERVTQLRDAERWTEASGILGLPKVRVYKISTKKKKKVKEEEKDDKKKK